MSYTDIYDLVVEQKIKITNHLTDLGIRNVRNEIVKGLQSERKYISSKFFYDKKGSILFEEITKLHEYYPTRTEKSILKKKSHEIMSAFRNADVVELGSGDCSKISIILNTVTQDSLSSINYIPVDISQSAIHESAHKLVEKFPELSIKGIVADFFSQLHLIPNGRKRIFFFLGSTLGNFSKTQENSFLVNLSSNLCKGDAFVLGLDLVKPVEILHKAYNDTKNITADFNKNILSSVNNIIQTNFNQNDFEHYAFFNKNESRIEMHLLANKDVNVTSPWFENDLLLKKGESIHTENSYKYSEEKIQRFSELMGLKIKKLHKDDNDWFALVHFEK